MSVCRQAAVPQHGSTLWQRFISVWNCQCDINKLEAFVNPVMWVRPVWPMGSKGPHPSPCLWKKFNFLVLSVVQQFLPLDMTNTEMCTRSVKISLRNIKMGLHFKTCQLNVSIDFCLCHFRFYRDFLLCIDLKPKLIQLNTKPNINTWELLCWQSVCIPFSFTDSGFVFCRWPVKDIAVFPTRHHSVQPFSLV